MTVLNACLVSAARLEAPWSGDLPPLLIIDLSCEGGAALPLHLPPCPVIGIGDRGHPLAVALDAIVEPPMSLASLVANIGASPVAAATCVHLLRSTEDQPVSAALVAESLAYGLLQGGGEHRAWLGSRTCDGHRSAPGELQLERKGAALELLIDRQAARNAIDVALRDQLYAAFELAALDETIERVDLRGAGKAFGVGADLQEFGTTRDPALAHLIRMQTLPAHAALRCAEKLHVHIQGACIGSALEMAAFAAHIEAAPGAYFHLPELRMGLIPGAGGCVSVPRRIGRQRCGLMILSGRRIDARTALAWGLVDTIMD